VNSVEKVKNDIQLLLEKYARDYHNHDLDGIMFDWARDDTVMLYGTGADEKRIGWQAIREQVPRNFAEAEELLFEWVWTDIQVKGQVGWLAADARVKVTVNGKQSDFSI